MVTPQTARASPSSLNRKIKERMALLIQHQRLANGADSLPPAPLSRTTNSTISQIVVDDALSTKQNSLDKAISDNKAALAQLGSLIGKEQKLALMKAVSERNMFVPSTSLFRPPLPLSLLMTCTLTYVPSCSVAITTMSIG